MVVPKVALDASLWDEPTTGIGLYTRCLAEGIAAQGILVERVGARMSGEHPRGSIGRTAFTLGKLPALLASIEVPIFHALSNFNLPLTRIPGKWMVVTVHDLIPEILPQTVSYAYHWQFRLWLSRSVQLADRIVCISRRTRDDLVERYPIAEGKTEVVHQGADHLEQVPPLDSIERDYLAALALPERYLVYAGSLDVRKNLGLLLDAQRILRQRGRSLSLILVGQRWFGSGPVEEKIAQMRSEGFDIRPLGYQSDAVFYEIIRRGFIFVFPSRYEGFGLPPLEAMSLGVPTIVARAGAMPEVCGTAALYVDPDDAGDLADQIITLLDSDSARAELIRAGKSHAQAFTWKKTAEQTADVYRTLL